MPLIIVPQPRRASPNVIPLTANSRDEVSIYLGAVRDGGIPVYICKPTPIALTDVIVVMSGLNTDVRHDERLVPFAADRRSFARIEPMTAQLIQTRNVMRVGETIDQRRVCFNQNNKVREGVAYLSKSFEQGFITMAFVATPMHDDSP